MNRTYSELIRIPTFKERYDYLRIGGKVGAETFGYDRYLNQILYTSNRWRRTRRNIIIRDNGCDLGIEGFDIYGSIYVHHINPITKKDVEMQRSWIFNPEYLICSSFDTHNAIHYGDESLLPQLPVERRKNDTCPWR